MVRYEHGACDHDPFVAIPQLFLIYFVMVEGKAGLIPASVYIQTKIICWSIAASYHSKYFYFSYPTPLATTKSRVPLTSCNLLHPHRCNIQDVSHA